MTRAAFAGAVVLLLACACAINPVTGRPQAVLTSEAQEIEQGRELAKQIEAQAGLLDHPALAGYLDQLGQRLAAHSPRQTLPYRFHVLDVAEPNAFALAGGDVYVTRGLLALVNSEDELGCVIGHEIAHVAARHAASEQVRSAVLLPARVAAGLGGLATSIVSPTLGRAVTGMGQLPAALTQASYSRAQEREADRLGQQLAASAGWDPVAMSRFLATLGREEALAGDDGRSSFFASHPSSPERSAETLEFAATLARTQAAPIAAGQEAFLRRLDGLIVGTPAADGVFVDNLFLHPALRFAFSLPKGWETRNRREVVLARSPDKQRFVALSFAGKGDDPEATAAEFARERGLRDKPRLLRIGGLPAVFGIHEGGSAPDALWLHLTWIAHGGAIYRLAGISPVRSFEGDQSSFDATARSFHELTRNEREQVFESRLRFTEARRDESLARLLARAASAWTLEEAAVANALEPGAVLSRGNFVKFARREPWVAP